VLTSVFNGTGYIQGDLAGFGSLFGDEGLLVIDSSQEIGRGIAPILRDRADALIFSGHKVFGALGTGVLWLSDRMVAKLDNSTVAAHAEMEGLRTSARHPHESITAVVERASPNLPAISAFCAALKLSQSWGASAISQVIRERVVELLDGLKELKSCQIVSNPFYSMRSGIVAFRHTALTPKECEAYLGESNVFVRGGNLCRTRSKDDVVRVSVHCYTSQADISRFVRVLSRLEGA
jgi:cysteine desulfurase/selenocysteine lyase